MEYRISEEDRFPSKVVCMSRLSHAITNIKKKLNKQQMSLFEKSPFGVFLSVKELQWAPQLVHQVLLRQVVSPLDEVEGRLVFNITEKRTVFSIREYNIITGLRCHRLPDLKALLKDQKNRLVNTIFRGKQKITGHDLEKKFLNCRHRQDTLKLALVYFVEFVLMGKEGKVFIDLDWLELVDDTEEFSKFPWGTLSFRRTVDSLNGALIGRVEKYKLKVKQKKGMDFYALVGFPYAFQVSFQLIRFSLVNM